VYRNKHLGAGSNNDILKTKAMKKLEVIKTRNLLAGNPQQGVEAVEFSGVKSTKLSYAKFKNLPRIKAEAEAIENTIKELAPLRYTELKEQLIEAVKPLIENTTDPRKAFEIEQKFIQEWDYCDEWKAETAAYQKQINEFLEEETTIELHRVAFNELPEDLTDAQFQAISIFIAE